MPTLNHPDLHVDCVRVALAMLAGRVIFPDPEPSLEEALDARS